MEEFLRIEKVEPLPDMGLQLTYRHGPVIRLEFRSVAARGGMFARLADPDYFAQVQVACGGRAICWPDELDFCADALWLRSQVEGADVVAPVQETGRAGSRRRRSPASA